MPTDALHFGRFELRPAERLLLEAGQPVALGVRALDVLVALAQRRERVVPADELIELAWPGLVVEPNNLQVQVSALRKLLGPDAIATVKRRGYQFTARLHEPGPPSAAPAVPLVPHRLPLPRTRFIGREAALADGARLLAGTRLLTLTGTGGSGKTRLATELARRALADFPGGAWFVDLAALQDPQRLPAAIGSVVGAGQGRADDPVDALVARLAPARALLLLDNCEHLLAAVAALADRLLAGCEGLQLLATSREGLGLPGEQIYAVHSLGLPRVDEDDAEALAASDAVRLFVDRARLSHPDFSLTAANAPVVADICRRLDGIALAIELAAARVRMFPVDEIRARLDDRFRFLTGSAHAPPRHRTLAATLGWSVRLLSEAEAVAFARLSVFAGGCTLAAAAVAAGLDDEYVALQVLTQLHDKSLLVMAHGDLPEPRFRMLETVRQFAQDRLDDAGDAPAVRARCLDFFVRFAEEAGGRLHGPAEMAWLRRLEAEEANLVAAHDWCADLPEGADAGWRLVAALGRYWTFAGPLDVGYRLAAAAVARSPRRLDDTARGKSLQAMSHIAYRRGFYEEALAWAEQGVALAEPVGDPVQVAAAQSHRASAWHALARTAEAEQGYERAIALLRAAGVTDMRLVVTLNNLAEIHRGRGRHAEALALYEEGIALARALDVPSSVCHLLCNVARLQVAAGRLAAAREAVRPWNALVVQHRLPKMAARLAEVAAGLAALEDEPAQAAYLWGMVLARLRENGERLEPVDEAFIAPLMARARAALGDERFQASQAAGERLPAEAAEAVLAGILQPEASALASSSSRTSPSSV